MGIKPFNSIPKLDNWQTIHHFGDFLHLMHFDDQKPFRSDKTIPNIQYLKQIPYRVYHKDLLIFEADMVFEVMSMTYLINRYSYKDLNLRLVNIHFWHKDL